MHTSIERRQQWTRIIGVERRHAPFQYLGDWPLPDPTRLEDEDFTEGEAARTRIRKRAQARYERWHEPGRFE